MKKKLPHFNNEKEEFEFWETHNALDYFDTEHPITSVKIPNLKFSAKNRFPALVRVRQSVS